MSDGMSLIERRWTITGGDRRRSGGFWPHTVTGSHIDPGAAVEVVPLTSYQGAVEALEHIARVWKYGNGAGPYARKALERLGVDPSTDRGQ